MTTWTRIILLSLVCFQQKPSSPLLLFVADAFVIQNESTKKHLQTSLPTTTTTTTTVANNLLCITNCKNVGSHTRTAQQEAFSNRKTSLFVSTHDRSSTTDDQPQQEQYPTTNNNDSEDNGGPQTNLSFMQQSRLDSAMSDALFRTNLLMENPECINTRRQSPDNEQEDDDSNNNDMSVIRNLLRHCQDSVYVSKSTIPNAGQGLFAKQDLSPGSIVSFYPVHAVGVNLINNGAAFTVTLNEEDQEYFEANTNGDNYLLYLMGNRPMSSTDKTILAEVEGQPFINVNPTKNNNKDSNSDSSWLCHFINDGAIISENTERGVVEYYESTFQRQNCVLLPFGPSPLCVATTTKAISKGEELFVSYGYSYWLDALVGDTDKEKWTEKTDAIRALEYNMFEIIMDGIEYIHEEYSKEDTALHSLFNNLD